MAATRTVAGVFPARTRAEATVDAVVTAVAFAATLVLMLSGSEMTSPARIAGAVALAAAASLPLLVWRRAPVGVFAVTLLASACLMALGYPGAPPVGATIALYLAATRRDDDHPWTWSLTALVAGLFAAHFLAFAVGHRQPLPAAQIVIGALTWSVAWFAGDRTRLRRQEVRELKQRAVRAERDAERDRRLALAEERTRIARDLHDSAAHAVNVIAVQAGAARLHMATDPVRSSRALETIEEVARRTVAEIDQIVHGLRAAGGAGGIEPPATLAAVDGLVRQHRAAGLDIAFERRGPARPLTPAVDGAVYRILQEALTNCARHGTGKTRAQVVFGDAGLELTIVNAAAGRDEPRANGGHGLLGMRERAAMLGGELEVERRDGTFRVHAALPYGTPA